MIDVMSKWSSDMSQSYHRRRDNRSHNTHMRRHPTAPVLKSDYYSNLKQRLHNRSNDYSHKPLITDSNGTQLMAFKTSANYFDPCLPRERPFMGASCARCTTVRPRSKTENDVFLSALGLANMLRVPIQNREQSIISRSFYYASFVMSRKVDSDFPDVCRKVIKCDRVNDAIKEVANEELKELHEDEDESGLTANELKILEQKHRSRAIEILQRMKSCISSSLLRIAGWVLYKLLSRMLTTIQFHKGQIERLRRCKTTANVPIIYLPLHRSHLDYILVSFILYMNNIKPPLVAAGDNLLIPFFGNLMRGLGAFFIKRRLDHKSGKKDTLYRAVLQSYMTENLREGNSLEFFIEGSRSRSGKALMPKSGLLSVVVDSVLEGVVEDAFIVPVAISYEKLIDGSFIGEQLGKPKVMESFSLAARSIWSTLHSNFGSVRVDFCQPFSLKDYLRNEAYNLRGNNITIDGPLTRNHSSPPACVACSGLRKASAFKSVYGLDIVVSEDKRQTIENLGEHVVYDAFNAMPLMSTHLVAFLMLTKHRKGTSIHKLAHSLNWIREECKRKNRDLSVSGDSMDIIRNACTLLGKDLISVEKMSMAWTSSADKENNNVKIVFLKPSVKLPHVLDLQYYGNSCISIFQLDSVIVNSLFAIIDSDLESLTASGDKMESNITVDFNELIDKSEELCEILQNDFLFAPPCANIRDLLSDAIESMILFGLLTEAHRDDGVSRELRHRYREYDFDDEEDDGYIGCTNSSSVRKRELKIALNEECKQTLQFYRSVLAPYIESYWVAASTLSTLIGADTKEEKQFFDGVLEMAKEKQRKGLLFHEESIAAEPLKNALKLFDSWHVLSIETSDSSDARRIQLRPEFNTIEAINDVIVRIEEFKK